ncbi:MAG: sporulation protein YqfD, partial [Bacilli bacterium]
LSNTIFNVDIICSSDVTRELIKEELNALGIKKYSFKKSYKKLNNIKKILLENNKEKLQWIEIVEKGTTYIIEITPRDIEENKNKTQQNKNIVAKKDALITHLVVEEGDALKTIGEYVHKGEIIVSGNIMNNETLKKQVNAKAKVMGEVWYTSTTKVPYTFNEYVKQNKKVNEYHMTFFSKDIVLLGLYKTDNAFIKKTTILDKPYLFFKLYKKEKELYLYKTYNLKEDEALKEALRRSDEAIKLKLKKDEYIIDKKVLKIRNFSSRIEIEVFYRVNEDISLSLDIEDL